jgi:hypothetical protein
LEAGVFFVNTDNLGDSLVAFSGMVNELGLHGSVKLEVWWLVDSTVEGFGS